jgi:hypothetical protein
MVYIHMFAKIFFHHLFYNMKLSLICPSINITCIDKTSVIENTMHHLRIVMINLFVIVNMEKNPTKCISTIGFHLICWACNFWKFIVILSFSISWTLLLYVSKLGCYLEISSQRTSLEKIYMFHFQLKLCFHFHLITPFLNKFSRCYSLKH